MDLHRLEEAARNIRKGILTQVFYSQSGHPGGSLSAVEILTYLYFEEMNIDVREPKKPDRDRFILSKGHASPVYYAALANRGYFPVEDLKTFRKFGSHLQGHPCMQECPGVDMSTGSLGQGFAVASGMALSAKMSGDDYRVYALCGDGELQEGEIWETAMFAGHKKLNNLTVLIDNNNLQIDGTVMEVCNPHPIEDKFRDFHFRTICIDGHDFHQIGAALDLARGEMERPTAIIASTIKGKGISFMENRAEWHGKAPDRNQYEQAMRELEMEGNV